VLGRYEEAGKTVVFVLHGEESLVVRVGDVIAKDYKVEKLNESTLFLRYIPLDQVQELALGESH
jgi:hypothetical protein